MSDDTISIVTGGGRGIGRAIAHDLAAGGHHVLVIARTDTAVQCRDEIADAGGSATALVVDITDYGVVGRQLAAFLAKCGQRAHINAVLTAGTVGPKGPLEKNEMADWERVFQVNLFGNLAVAGQLLGDMRRRGRGRVVTFAGGGSAYAYPVLPAYAASKAAMVRAVENIAEDMGDVVDFSIVCLAPGAIETDMLREVRAAGGFVKTVTGIDEPVGFVRRFVGPGAAPLSGRFLHVRDTWPDVLDGKQSLPENLWKLRRVE